VYAGAKLRDDRPYQGEFYDLRAMYGTCESAGVPIVQGTTPVDARCRERIRTGFSRMMTSAELRRRLCHQGPTPRDRPRRHNTRTGECG
jgi:hypothetical protein